MPNNYSSCWRNGEAEMISCGGCVRSQEPGISPWSVPGHLYGRSNVYLKGEPSAQYIRSISYCSIHHCPLVSQWTFAGIEKPVLLKWQWNECGHGHSLSLSREIASVCCFYLPRKGTSILFCQHCRLEIEFTQLKPGRIQKAILHVRPNSLRI